MRSSAKAVSLLVHAAVAASQLQLVKHGLDAAGSPAYGSMAVSADAAYYFQVRKTPLKSRP
jgi:hypothetical protein